MRAINTILFSFISVAAFAQFPKAEPRQIEDADTSFIFILANSSKIYAHSDSVTFLNDETAPNVLVLDTVGGYNRLKWRSASGLGGSVGGFTEGSVIFAAPAGTLTEDNAEFFWDDTNDRLGIGTSSPSNLIHVNAVANQGIQIGSFLLTRRADNAKHLLIRATAAGNSVLSVAPNGGTGLSSFEFFGTDYAADAVNYERIQMLADVGNANVIKSDAGGTGTKQDLNIYASSSGQLYLDTGGNIGLGDATPDYILDIDASSNAVALPTGTDAQRPTGQLGLLRASSTSNFLEYHNGTSWVDMIPSPDGSFTSGSVIFADADGTLTQDNAEFFWDDTNDRLGIGTSSPSNLIHVNAVANQGIQIGSFLLTRRADNAKHLLIRATAAGNSVLSVAPNGGTGLSSFEFFGTDYAADATNYERLQMLADQGNANVIRSNSGGTGTKQDLDIYASSSGQLYLDTGGNIGLGDATPDYILDIDASSNAVALPNGTDAQRPTGQAGLFRYGTEDNLLEFHNGTSWLQVGSTPDGGFTPGSVIFADTDGTLTEDNAELFWSNSNNRLGLGTNVPTHKLHVNTVSNDGIRIGGYTLLIRADDSAHALFRSRSAGNGVLSIAPNGANISSFEFFGTDYVSDATNYERIRLYTQVGGSYVLASEKGGTGTKRDIDIFASSSGQLYLDTGGNVGIGDATPDYALDIDASTDAIALPLGLDATRPVGQAGLLRFSTTSNLLEFHNGSTWVDVASGAGHTGTQGSVFFAAADGTPTEDNANFFWDDTNDRLGIGTAAPGEILDLADSQSDNVILEIENSGGTAGHAPTLMFRRARGTLASPTAVQSGDVMGYIYINGRTDTGWEGESRVIQIEAAQTWTSTAAGYNIAFYTRPNGSVGGQTQRMQIENNGKVSIGSSSASYILDIDDSTDAIAAPTGTDAQRPTIQDGLLRHNTDGDGMEFGDNSTWFDIHGKGTDRAGADNTNLTYTSGDRGAIIRISDITDNATIITYTLPALPLDKTIITVECKTGSVIDADDGCRIVGNGNNIQGSANYDFAAANKPVTIRYSTVLGEWKIIATE